VAELSGAQARLIDEATAAPAGSASLSDIQHVVILMQENRSFDHYFGTMSGVRGFSDPNTLSQFTGYYTREDLPFYYALADAFTVCDSYFSSVIGPTDPNRVMAISASIDPDEVAGGPVVETFGNRIAKYGKLTWETMPQRLQAAGVSWKVYSDRLCELALSPLPYFKAFTDPFSITGVALAAGLHR
jgi:phospholipase C